MKKSKLLALLLALTMLLSLAACGGNDDKQPDDSTPGQSDNKGGDTQDPGEDKPDNDIEYSGLADFDRYRETEADWLKGVVASEEFRQAPLRIVLLHIPPLHYDWHGGREIQRLFMPLLQGAGVDLMLCGHLHKAFYTAAGEDKYDFPVLINSNRECVRVTVEGRKIEAEIRDAAGKTVARHTVRGGRE